MQDPNQNIPSLTSGLQPFGIRNLPGENDKYEVLELDDKYVQLAQNTRFEIEPGATVKRPPLTHYNTASLGAGAVVGKYWHTSGGTDKLIVVHGTAAYIGDDANGTFTQIRDSLTSGKRCSFVTYQGLTVVHNGFNNPWVTDGAADNVTWELGSCKALLGVSTGITATSISYRVTIDADTYVTATTSNTIASASNEDIVLTNIPLGPSGTVNRKIYRKDSGTSSAYKLLTTINDNSTKTYTDSTVSASLGANIPTSTDTMPLGSKARMHRERMFVGRDPDNPNRVYYSNPYLIHYIQATTNTDYMDISPDDGDSIQDFPIHLNQMIVIKKKTVRRIYITSATSGADPSTWYAEDPFAFTGTPAPWSVIQTQRGVVFLGWDHWKLWDGGGSIIDIIDEFSSDRVLDSRYEEVVAFWTQKDLLLAAYTGAEEGTQYNNYVMRWNFKRSRLSRDTSNVNVFSEKTGEDGTGEIYYGASNAGYVYKTEVSEIFYKLETKAQAEAGTLTQTYVGGTTTSPYIEIGSLVSASAIPFGICVLWESSTTTPGSGWDEVTSYDGYFLKIADEDPATTGAVTLSDTASVAKNIKHWRLFKKNSSTTEYELPDGSIVGYDQPSDPTGFTHVNDTGYLIKVDSVSQTSESVELPITTGAGGTNLDNMLGFRFIKKTSESDTWDGVSNYIYCLYLPADDACVLENVGDTVDKTAHGLANADIVELKGTLPGELSLLTEYYVVNKTTNDFQLSATEGGGVIDFTSDGSSVTYQVRKTAGWTDVSSTYDDRYLETGETGVASTNGATTTGKWDVVQLSTTDHTFPNDQTNVSRGYDEDWTNFHGGTASGEGGTGVTATADHEFQSAVTLEEIVVKCAGAGDAAGSYIVEHNASCKVQYATSADPSTWVTFTGMSAACSGGAGSCSVSSWTDFTGGTVGADNRYTKSFSTADVLKVRIEGGGFGNHSGGGGSSSGTGQVFDLQVHALVGSFLTARLAKKVLGQMKDYNSALTSHVDNGIWVSPGLDLGAQELNNLSWNENFVSGDDVTFFTRTASSQALVEGFTATTADNTADKFTNASHNLVNGDRVQIKATTLPTGISDVLIYYVVGVASNDWQVSLTSGGAAVTFSTDGTAVTYKEWEQAAGLSDPNGTAITSTAAAWLQYLIWFDAAATNTNNPQVTTVGGYAVRIGYAKGGTVAETSVDWVYQIGFRNFSLPDVDKYFKKIATVHEGTLGSLSIYWETEESSGTFTIDLQSFPKRWASFFPDDAWGEDMLLKFRKNDLNDFRLKEFGGFYTPEPRIV